MSNSEIEELGTGSADQGVRNGTSEPEDISREVCGQKEGDNSRNETTPKKDDSREEVWDQQRADNTTPRRQENDDVPVTMSNKDEDHANGSMDKSEDTDRLLSTTSSEYEDGTSPNFEKLPPNSDNMPPVNESIDKSQDTDRLLSTTSSEYEDRTSPNVEKLPPDNELIDESQATDQLLSTTSSEYEDGKPPNSEKLPPNSDNMSPGDESVDEIQDTNRLLSTSSSYHEDGIRPKLHKAPPNSEILERRLKQLKEERDKEKEQEIDIVATDDPGSNADNIPTAQLFLNFLVAYFWIGPLVVIFWVSTWMIVSTIIIVPHRPTLSAWSSAAIGYGIFFISSCAQDKIRDFAYNRGKVTRYVISRVYSYIIALASINQWRSIWDLWEIYTGVSPLKGMAYSISCFFLLCLLRCCRQSLAPPACIALDFPMSSYFEMSTYQKMRVGSLKQVLDTLFTVVVVATLVIGVWRGLWEVFDTALYPDAFHISAAFNMLMSYSMAIFLIVTRKKMKKLAAWGHKKHWLLQLVIEDFITMMHTFCCITHWRDFRLSVQSCLVVGVPASIAGVPFMSENGAGPNTASAVLMGCDETKIGYWVLYDIYVLEPPVRYYVGHALGFVLLASVIASNSLLVRGCARDGQLPNGEGVIMDFHYFTNMIIGYRRRQKHKSSMKQQGNGNMADRMLAKEMDEAIQRNVKEDDKSLIV